MNDELSPRDVFCAKVFALMNADQNVWPPQPESGLDLETLGPLSGPLAELYQPRGESKPLPEPDEWMRAAIGVFGVIALLLIVVGIGMVLLFLMSIILSPFEARGRELLEKAVAGRRKTIAERPWAELVSLVQERDRAS